MTLHQITMTPGTRAVDTSPNCSKVLSHRIPLSHCNVRLPIYIVMHLRPSTFANVSKRFSVIGRYCRAGNHCNVEIPMYAVCPNRPSTFAYILTRFSVSAPVIARNRRAGKHCTVSLYCRNSYVFCHLQPSTFATFQRDFLPRFF